MANTRHIRRRIKAIKNTAQITKAMQMVAASKMRKAQELAMNSRPMAEGLIAMVKAASTHAEDDTVPPLMQIRPSGRTLVLVVSTNRGLCGALNTNLMRAVLDRYVDRDRTDFVTAGRKGRQSLARARMNLLADFEVGETIKFTEARMIGNFLAERYLNGDYARVELAFNNFVNTITQKPTIAQVLPLTPDPSIPLGSFSDDEPATAHHAGEVEEPLFEPSATEVLNELLPLVLNFQLFHYLLEAKASEHSARMIAMKNATDNAKEIVRKLTLEYNKVRQASITQEILEIATAQMALG